MKNKMLKILLCYIGSYYGLIAISPYLIKYFNCSRTEPTIFIYILMSILYFIITLLYLPIYICKYFIYTMPINHPIIWTFACIEIMFIVGVLTIIKNIRN